MRKPCIQKQLRYYCLAQDAGERWLACINAEQAKEALDEQLQMERWYRLYKEWGGTLKLMSRGTVSLRQTHTGGKG
jgi:hypothetical protein